MRKLTLFIASLFLCMGMAWAQTGVKGDAFSASALNELTENTIIAVNNISHQNNWYFAGDKNVQDFQNSEAWLVVEPQGNSTFYLRKYGSEDGYLQKDTNPTGEPNITIGAKENAQLFTAAAVDITEENRADAAASDGKHVRFLLDGSTRRINCENTGNNPIYCDNDRNGAYTGFNVYAIKVLVANIGEQGYESLTAAIAAATAGQTITLAADVNENVTISKSLTIDGANHKYTGKMTANKGLTVTVQNVNFVNAGFEKPKEQNSTTGTYTLKNCTFDGEGKFAYPIRLYGANVLNVENCTVKDYLYSFLYVVKATLSVNVKNVTVDNCPNYAVYFASGVTNATFEGLTVKNGNNGFIISNTANRKLTIKDCTMENVNTAINHTGGTSTITVNAEGDNNFGTAAISQYVKFDGAAALLGGKLYDSFDAAYTAAQDGDVITLFQTAVITNSKNWVNYSKKNITVKANFGSTAFRVQDGAYVWFGGMTIESDDYCITVGASDKSSGADVEIMGGTYKGNTSAISVTKGSVKITDGTFSVEPYEGSYDYTINCIDSEYKAGTAEVSIKGGKFYNFNPGNNAAEGAGTNFLTGDYAAAKDAEGWYTVGAAVAETGGVQYISLADAVAAAEDGATVTVCATASSVRGAGVVIDKNITIDFNGKTYSFNQGVGSTGTESNGLQILKGNTVVLKNGTLNVYAGAASKFYTIIQNYADLTVEDMTLDGTNLDKWSKTDGDSYVLSNNSGNVLITGNTNITANNDGDKAFAFDACDKTANGYTLPVVTVETTGKIAGLIENTATIAIKSGVFTTPIQPEWCAAGYIPTDNGDGTYGVAVDPLYGKVAQVGAMGYETLAEAIAAATAGETITLLADVNESVTVNKSLTIDGNGKNFTGAMTSKGGYYITVKNVNFNGNNAYNYAITVETFNDLTVEGCTAKDYKTGFIYFKSGNMVTVNDVTVENMAAAFNVSRSNSSTLENVTLKNVTYGLHVQNYGARTYTLKNWTVEDVEYMTYVQNKDKAVVTFVIDGGSLANATLHDSQYAEYVYDGVVAEIGNKKFISLAAAFEAAQDGETVTLLSDVELGWDNVVLAGSNSVLAKVEDKDITFDMNGKKISVNHQSTTDRIFAVIYVGDGAGLTVTGEGAIDVDVDDNTPKVVYMFWKRGTTGHLTIENGNFHMDNSEDSMVYTNGGNIVTVNGGTFVLDAIDTRENGFPWIFNVSGNDANAINVTGGTYNWDIRKQYWAQEVELADGLAMAKVADNLWTVAPAVAAIDGFGYVTLAEAVEAAEAEETVTLVADATGAGVVINKDVTIDFNEKTYTFNAGVGSTGTESNGLQILKGNTVVLKNGTLNVADEAADKFYILVQNYADLTVEDMTLDGTNLDKWAMTDGDSYVLSNNSGDVLITGNTNIIANNDGDKAFAFDACDKTANGYELPTVYVETTGKIAGLIERTGDATIAISSGVFTTPILPEWCAEYYVPVTNEDGTYGVESRYTEEMTIVDGSYTEFVNEKEQTVGTLTYTRKFTNANKWQGLYVPFEIPVASLNELGYEVAYLYDVHNHEIAEDEIDPTDIESIHFVKIKKGTLRANYPYIIRPTSEADLTLALTLYDAKLYSTAASEMNSVESSTTITRYIFAGTYTRAKRATLTGDDNTPCYAIWPDGIWYPMSATNNLAPFRIFMYIVNKDNSPVVISGEAAKAIKIRVIGEENEDGTTLIYDVENDAQSVDYIYDLQGRRVLEPQKGGLYIVNGKKVIF